MIQNNLYILIILSLSGSLLGLLGSTSIFVSLIIQRRVERLQEILEDLVNLSFEEGKNLSSEIYQLINRYQMHYILPHGPSNAILWYIDYSIAAVIILWVTGIIMSIRGPFTSESIFYMLPQAAAIAILLVFRRLLKNAINPLDNPLFNAIIPPPAKLRSISFLSNYVNISVKSILKQARINISIERKISENHRPSIKGRIVLKQELSFDDFYYYISVYDKQKTYFLGFGYLILDFPPDNITAKPIPIQRNMNITLGHLLWEDLPDNLEASFLVFPVGEKNPIEFYFKIEKDGNFFMPITENKCFINQNIVYKVQNGQVALLKHESTLSYLEKALQYLGRQKGVYFVQEPFKDFTQQRVQICTESPRVQ
ncbi:MAG: hypothetical protein AB1420_12610 [Bacillota bacterium]